MSRRSLAAAAALVLGVFHLALAAGAQPAATASRFAAAKIRFEQNATDGDVEVVIEVVGRKEGLAKLKVVAPDGRTVIDFNAPSTPAGNGAEPSSGTGIRQFLFESPEPTDVAAVKAAYPAGEYAFTGATVSGTLLESKATLSHQLPATTAFVSPKAEAENVPTANLIIRWAPVPGVSGYALELTHEDSGASVEARLPASATSFSVPNGFLAPGESYQLGIGTVSADGNASFVETEFGTADGK
jgi:hypothetical protein